MPKINVDMIMFIRLNFMPNKAIAPKTTSQLSKMGAKPRSVWRILKRKLNSNTTKTKAMLTHCKRLKSSLSAVSVSRV